MVREERESPLSIVSGSREDTRAIGRAIGSLCRGGEAILLFGDLGTGKTCLVQGLALGLGVPEGTPVASPTFVLHVEYRGRLWLNHLDLYRLETAGELAAMGVDDLLGAPGAVFAAEWPELLEGLADGGHLAVRLGHLDEARRTVEFSAAGERHRTLLSALAAAKFGLT